MKEKRKLYPTDLTDGQWRLIQPLLSSAPKRGRPAQDLREIVNGVLYIFRSGLDWRMMPHDLPAWQTVYGYYKRWLADGTWDKINDHLRTRHLVRQEANPTPIVLSWISQRLKHIKDNHADEANQMVS